MSEPEDQPGDPVDPDPAELEETWDDRTTEPEPDQVDGEEPVDVQPAPEAVEEPAAELEEPQPPALEETGHAGVDGVLATLQGLEQRSVHEHVSVFEEAHAGLRRALDETDQQV